MKSTKKAKASVKKAAQSLGPRAVRDLELMDPSARKLKGGAARKPNRSRGPR